MRGILHSNLTHNIARFQAHQRRIAPKHPVLTHQRHVNVTTASSSGSTSPPSSPDEQASVNPPKSSSNAPSPEPSHPSNANNNGSNHKAQNRLQRLLSKRGRWPSLEDANLPLWIKLVFKAGALVKQQLVALILLHGCIDVVTFLLHRVSHRMTNAVAVQLLPAVTAESIGNPYWLSNNPEIATWATGYQGLGLAVFLCVFPLELALRSVAMAITGMLVSNSITPSSTTDNDPPRRGFFYPVLHPWHTATQAISTAWTAIAPSFRAIFQVDIRVALQVIPLQLVSWLALPLPWTLPRMVRLQMAQPLAVMQGARGPDALAQSTTLMTPVVWQYTVPYMGLFVLVRTLDPLRQLLFDLIPQRWYRELPEIPLLMVVGFALGGVVLARLRDVLPYALYALEFSKPVVDGQKEA